MQDQCDVQVTFAHKGLHCHVDRLEIDHYVTVHDKMANLRQQGTNNGELRHRVGTRFETIYCRYGINEAKDGGTVKFEFWQAYKSQMVIHQTTLGILRTQLLHMDFMTL